MTSRPWTVHFSETLVLNTEPSWTFPTFFVPLYTHSVLVGRSTTRLPEAFIHDQRKESNLRPLNHEVCYPCSCSFPRLYMDFSYIHGFSLDHTWLYFRCPHKICISWHVPQTWTDHLASHCISDRQSINLLHYHTM